MTDNVVYQDKNKHEIRKAPVNTNIIKEKDNGEKVESALSRFNPQEGLRLPCVALYVLDSRVARIVYASLPWKFENASYASWCVSKAIRIRA